jgi:hypothetical protein
MAKGRRKVKRAKSSGRAAAASQPAAPVALVVNPFGPTDQRKIKKSKVLESTFTLDDGTKLLVKPILSDIRRALGQFDLVGQPIYFVTLGQMITTKAPKKLQRKK